MKAGDQHRANRNQKLA